MDTANRVGSSSPSSSARPALQFPVFVTGGSGFVGGAVVDHLVAASVDVRALARSQESADLLRAKGATPVGGDVGDRAALVAGMSGCDVVFHVAGVNTMCPADPGTMYRTNVDGVRAVVGAAVEAGVRRIVLTSSAATVGESKGTVANEETVHDGMFLSHYARSKYFGELAFFEEASGLGIEAVAVNPSSVQGPGRTSGSALILRLALNMHRPVAVATTLSIVDIDDCAHAHLLAAERGEDGSRYLISGASVTVHEAVMMLSEIVQRPIEPIMIPRVLANVAYPVVAVAGLVRGDRPICIEMLRTLLHGHRFDVSRSIRDLGMSYAPIAETFDRTVQWLSEEGFVGL
ncbi:MAG: NAD-dependent epimerase/dehydratase family protein [Acidimicrobiia bacterium]